MRHASGAVSIAVVVLAASVSGAQKITKSTVTFDEQPRTYYTYLPAGTAAVPLVVLLHGSGRDGTTLINPWESLAKKEGIALVAPDASVKQYWNIGRDGPAFLKAIVDAMLVSGRIDESRVYLFGHSAGGHHSIDMGLLESEYFAAVAVHAGALTHDHDVMTGHADRKIPIAMWNGTDDQTVRLPAVREVRDYLVGKGFDVKLTEMKGHTHDYYSRANDINKEAWAFLKAHKLAAAPKYKEYKMAK
ncbi:MAG TPA: PHB depolymerase family esterase [Vicinamibacterales bacterium]|nr:PHB depolymerase family esterase [Vicinamibacterales bacterium]